MNEKEIREKYRTARLENTLECGAAKAASMASRLSYLGDEQFEEYADQAARTVADLKARAGVPGVAPTEREADIEKVRASVSEYMDSVFDLDDNSIPRYFAEAESERRR